MRTVFIPVALCVVLAGCASTTKKPAPPALLPTPKSTPAAPSGPAPNDNLNAVVWMQTAVERDLIYREVFRAAGEQMRAALKDPKWDALPKRDRKEPLSAKLKPAVIVDVDETVLDNAPYEARLVAEGKDYDEFGWAEWCRERRARPLPGAVEFARDAAKRGITVFYISNRAKDLDTATLENLRTAGFPIAERETVFLGLGTVVEGCEQNGSEKGCRRELVGRTHRVLMQFGDQIGDFVDVDANTPEGRRAAVEPYLGWIGQRWFVLPNPAYGSWEPALFNNDWTLPVEARRKAKLDALRLK
ncbi:MAG TPA: HAD family acid phosphatase [Rhodanobacteraceae bacterium]|jgi:acid phosphatase|nr:HAD family acid phosphatase [Rhodanobacteraceae bacterium]